MVWSLFMGNAGSISSAVGLKLNHEDWVHVTNVLESHASFLWENTKTV